MVKKKGHKSKSIGHCPLFQWVIIQATDAETDQGRLLCPYLSVDFEDNGDRFCYDDVLFDIFFVDVEPLADEERTEEQWPKQGAGGLYWDYDDLYLHTDGYAGGEKSVWMMCCCAYMNVESARLRARDDVNNWARTGELAAVDIDLTVSPPAEVEWDQPAEFTAQISGSVEWQALADYIEWFVLVWNPVEQEYEELDYWEYQQSGFESVVQDPPWIGDTFTVENLRDCEFMVRAKIAICGVEFSDDGGVELPPEIDIDVEPGSPRHDENGASLGSFYLIDGPSIPIYPGGEGDWHPQTTHCGQCMSIETIDPPDPVCCTERHQRTTTFYPEAGDLLSGQVKTRITWSGCVPHIKVFVDIDADGDDLILKTAFNTSAEEQPYEWVWDISGSSCGPYAILVRAYMDEDEEPGDYIAEAQSDTLELDKVKVHDLMEIAPIYHGDGHLWGGSRCPHRNECWYVFDEERGIDANYCGTVDCSAYLTQLLKRINRNVSHIGAAAWGNSPRVTEVSWDTVQWGDIVVWCSEDVQHVAIFVKWINRSAPRPVFATYEARGLIPGVGHFEDRTVSGAARPYTWVENVVFKTCE
jgi:hypothetical protein